MVRTYSVLIEQDEDGTFVGRVPELRGCITQGDTLDDLMKNMKEAISLYLDVQTENKSDEEQVKFVGVQQVEVV